MKIDTDYRSLCEQLWAKLPPPLSGEQIQVLYGDAIDSMVKQAVDALSRPSVADLVVSVLRDAGTRFLKLVSHAADVVAETLPPVDLQPAMAARSMGGAPVSPSVAVRVEASRSYGAATLRVVVEASGTRQVVRIRLEDRDGNVAGPMILTLIDIGADEKVLDNRHFDSGEAVLRDVDPGDYLILAEGDEDAITLTLRIELPGS